MEIKVILTNFCIGTISDFWKTEPNLMFFYYIYIIELGAVFLKSLDVFD